MILEFDSKRPVSGEDLAKQIDKINREYIQKGLYIRRVGVVVEFVNQYGEVAEPTVNGNMIKKTIYLG